MANGYCYATSLKLTVTQVGNYTVSVAPPSANFVTEVVNLKPYAGYRQVELWYPLGDIAKTAFTLSWDTDPADAVYYVQVYADSGAGAFQQYSYSNHVNVNLPTGYYHWRVSAATGVGDQYITSSTALNLFSYSRDIR